MKLGWVQYIRMLIRGREVVQEAVSQGKIVRNVHSRSSWRSTEFWASILTGLGAIGAQAGGIIPPPYGAIAATSSAAFYAIARGLAKSGDPLGGVKPGATSTEFIATLVAQVGSILAAVSGAVPPETAAILVTISNGAYGLSRGLAKGGAQPQE